MKLTKMNVFSAHTLKNCCKICVVRYISLFSLITDQKKNHP